MLLSFQPLGVTGYANLNNAQSSGVPESTAIENVAINPQLHLVELLKTVISNHNGLAKKFVAIEKGFTDMYADMADIKANILTRPQSAMSVSSAMSSTDAQIDFQMIENEEDLIKFEKSIENPVQKKKLMEYFVAAVGVNTTCAENFQRQFLV